MTGEAMRWFVSQEGRVEKRPEDPGDGWSEVIDTDQLPENYDPATDKWMRFVVGTEGPVMVPLALEIGPDGEKAWRRDGDVLTLQQWLRGSRDDGHEIYGVAGSKGKLKGVERWR